MLQVMYGVHDENRDGRLPAAVRFCDYASAANEWRPENVCRTWFRVISDLTDVMRPYGREKSQEGRK